MKLLVEKTYFYYLTCKWEFILIMGATRSDPTTSCADTILKCLTISSSQTFGWDDYTLQYW